MANQYEVLEQSGRFNQCKVIFDPSAPPGLIERIINQVGERVNDAKRVEVAFADLLEEAGLTDESWWAADSANAITVPLGPQGARDVQELEIGSGMAHHGLIIGRPGSGKTNLMHIIITCLALKYSPEELELYLIDFKKGVGFKAYAEAKLPHARVIAIESEREFGISVLRGLDQELAARGTLFREKGIEKLSEYRKDADCVMPRIVLIADEFQEFFTADDAISREATLLLDRIVRQGRAFGIHLIMGTQTLGSYGMSRSTIDQMAIRIALQCSEADARLILGDDNPGARFLSRPGEAIYNAENGLVQANKLFQVALFTDDDKEQYLKRIRVRALNGNADRTPLVFEGHLPAHLDTSKDVERVLTSERPNHKRSVGALLGEPIAIKEATLARFRRQAGSNLLIVTRDEEQGAGVLFAAFASLAMQHSDDACRFIILDFSTADAEWANIFESFSDELPHETKVVQRRQIPETIEEILREVEVRHSRSDSPHCSLYLLINGVQRARDLRPDEEDYSGNTPHDRLVKILRDGPDVGVHTLAWSDTAATVSRTFSRKGATEFGLRVAGVMSADDSQSFLDDSIAAKIDRPHRMIFCDEEQPGVFEKFRPFAIPPKNWRMDLAQRIGEIQ